MKLTFSRQELLAALLFASEEDSRYVLNAVCLKYRFQKAPIAISTDGRRLTVIESRAEQEPSTEFADRQIVVRSDFIEPICALNKALCRKIFPWVTFENTPGTNRLTVSFAGGKFFMEANDGAIIDTPFPDWSKVVPSKTQKRLPISEVALSAEYIGDYAKAVKILEASSAIIQMNLVGKEQQIEVKLPAVPNFYGLVMQCKLQEGADYQPEFLGIVEHLTPEPKEETTTED